MVPCLVLSVLRPGEVFPHAGKISDLVAAPAPTHSPLMVVRPQHPRSYNTPKDAVLVSLTTDALRTDCEKIAKYARQLPSKLEYLYMECERMRQTAQVCSTNTEERNRTVHLITGRAALPDAHLGGQ